MSLILQSQLARARRESARDTRHQSNYKHRQQTRAREQTTRRQLCLTCHFDAADCTCPRGPLINTGLQPGAPEKRNPETVSTVS